MRETAPLAVTVQKRCGKLAPLAGTVRKRGLRLHLGCTWMQQSLEAVCLFRKEAGTCQGADLHPLLRKRLDEYLERIKADPTAKRHYSIPGTHAEILAADELLKAREAAGLPLNLDDFVSYQVSLNPKYDVPEAKFCQNCDELLPDPRSIPGRRE